MKTNRSLLLSWLLLGMLFVFGCGSDFFPPSYLNDLRILAIESTPLEVSGDEKIQLRPRVFVPDSETIVSEQWSFCPFSKKEAGAFECLLPSCLETHTPDQGGIWDFSPQALVMRCFEKASFDLQAPSGFLEEIPDKIDLVFMYSVVASTGQTRNAQVRIPYFLKNPPSQRNRSPGFQSVLIDGQEVSIGPTIEKVPSDREVSILVQVDPESLDEYEDATGKLRLEEPIVSFYATAGTFKFDRQSGVPAEGFWQAQDIDPDLDHVKFYFVARDLRGGQSVLGPITVELER